MQFHPDRSLPIPRCPGFISAVSPDLSLFSSHRRRGRELTLAADYAAAQPPAFEADTLEVASANQLLRRLETALLRQPRRSLDVFVLHRHEGLTYRAIAERFAISVSAVEKHMMRILLACDQALSA